MNHLIRNFVQKKTLECFMGGFGCGMVYSYVLFFRT